MTSKTFVTIFLVLATCLDMASAQSVQDRVRVENTEISTQNSVNCNDIIEVSKFEGDCCSMNVTAGNGCVLNIVNGNCVITGQYWTLDWTSTFKLGGAKCPPSEFPDFAPASLVADDDDEPEDSAAVSVLSDSSWRALVFSSIMLGGLGLFL